VDAMNSPQLSTIKRTHKEVLQLAMTKLLRSLANSIKVTNKFNVDNAMEIIEFISKQFYYLRFDELVIVFRNAKMGKYGNMFNRLDIETISKWIMIYEGSERADYLESLNRAPDKTKENKTFYDQWTPEAKAEFDKLQKIIKNAKVKEKAANQAAILAPGRHSKKQEEALKTLAANSDDATLKEMLAEYTKHNHRLGKKVFQEELKKRK